MECDETLNKEENFKSGFVTVIGQPNVGKSTLINHLIGQKIAITTPKKQTTRNKLQCILTRDNAQLIFIDTPGVHRPKDKMGEYMVDTAYKALKKVELIYFMVDAQKGITDLERKINNQLSGIQTPTIIVLNKIDLVSKAKLKDVIESCRRLGDYAELIPVSAETGENTNTLIDKSIELLPDGPKYYPEDMVTDQIEQFVITELIREKIMYLTREEVPHSVALEVVQMGERENKDLIDVNVNIYVERESQKGIIIGKGGKRLKEIGRRAREDIEALLGSQIYLDLWVKVRKDWRDKEDALKMLGYRG
ncbi:GTPase Era [Acetohalobium arabaticum]|uniref:GTPase Era n=1 Tax=Acetohalobium arabaticum (strain ATCC 49924 / DSM 5501 / Z-7288) TaxID=574087 RepID=D9QVA7_ACEAZ|nr:GTP-binding protein Era [Acetohalobium arabaticum DSM 5501]